MDGKEMDNFPPEVTTGRLKEENICIKYTHERSNKQKNTASVDSNIKIAIGTANIKSKDNV